MQKPALILSLALPVLMMAPQASANVIETACRQLDTASATAARCRCVGEVATQSLTKSDQRKVATWFKDPHQAQVVRQSDKRRDEKLWARYKAFGDAAARSCG